MSQIHLIKNSGPMEDYQKYFSKPLFTIIFRNAKISPICHFDWGNSDPNLMEKKSEI